MKMLVTIAGDSQDRAGPGPPAAQVEVSVGEDGGTAPRIHPPSVLLQPSAGPVSRSLHTQEVNARDSCQGEDAGGTGATVQSAAQVRGVHVHDSSVL